ncbi:MAG: hypothetical protein AB7P37_03445 [Ramlibacter sp.]
MNTNTTQRTGQREYPPLPEPDAYVAMSGAGSIIIPPQDFAKWGSAYKVFTADQMHAYIDTERAVAQADTQRLSGQPDRWHDAALPPEIEQRLAPWLTNGAALHPATVNLVVRFARALAKKLAAAEVKYGYSDGWMSPDWMDECRGKLLEHIAKGDPLDVAAYCAFLWSHRESTARAAAPMAPAEIKALTAMVWGAPCAGRDLAIVTSIVRAMEALRPGERPIDPAKGGRLLDVDACTVEPAAATAPTQACQVVADQKVFTIGMQVEAWHVYGMQGPLTAEQRTAVINFAHSFEECSKTPEELALMDDPELISTAYYAMAEYANGQL